MSIADHTRHANGLCSISQNALRPLLSSSARPFSAIADSAAVSLVRKKLPEGCCISGDLLDLFMDCDRDRDSVLRPS